jgi:serine protease AprX
MFKKLVALTVVAVSASLAFGQNKKIAPDLQGTNSTGSVNVIVQFQHTPTQWQHQKVFSRGGSLHADLGSIKAGAYSVPISAINDLAQDPEVAYISPDRPVTLMLDNSAAAVNAATAWNSYNLNGSGVGVAVIDSGVSNIADLKNRIVYSQSFVVGDADTQDHYGHGEHVAGAIAGNGANSTGSIYTRTFKGIAPGANIINLRVLDQNGNGSDSLVVSAIQEAISLQSTYNIGVINLSLGRPVFESYTQDPLCQAVEAAWKAGIVVVVSAGNDGRDNSFGTEGYATTYAPGNDPYVITVGAMNTMGTPQRTDDIMTTYSSKGPSQIDLFAKPDLVAPGNLVVSDLAPPGVDSTTGASFIPTILTEDITEYPQYLVPFSYYEQSAYNGDSSNYIQMSGTSMAAPVVSGAAALLLQQDPQLTPDEVKARLMKTAYKSFPSSTSIAVAPGSTYTEYYDIFTVGAGYLDIAAALANSDLAQGPALSPSVSMNATSATVTLVFNPSSVWAQPSLWSSPSQWAAQTVWGPVEVNANGSVWVTPPLSETISETASSQGTVLGQGTILGQSVILGQDVLLGQDILFGQSVIFGQGSKVSDPVTNILVKGSH